MNKETIFHLHGQLKGRDISFNYLVILLALPCSMSDIAEQMQVSTAAITGLVDKLEKKKLAVREHSEQDRRKVTVRLTPAGHEAVAFALDPLPDGEEKTHGEKEDAPSGVTVPTQA